MFKDRVTLFIPCLVDSLQPEVGEAVVKVLRKVGISLDYPANQTCCGQPAYNAGYQKEARIAAKRFIKLFEKSDIIVCPSGSCVNMVRHHYFELFKNDSKWYEKARRVSEKTFEFTEYLVDILGVDDIAAFFHGRITYHDSCSLLRGLGIKDQPRRLIRMVRGADFVEMKDSDRCCGFGGSFSFKYPGISSAILEEKVRNIVDSGAESVIGCDVGCLMNIQGLLSRKGIPIKAVHIAQLLARDEEDVT
jgi:L-lactate dehydrogenase complex protein LldE